jgi:hypothetical protein
MGMTGIATTLSEARSKPIWEGVFRRMAVHLTPQYGETQARALLMEAARLAFPPSASEPWDFEAGIAIDDHLQPLVARLGLRHASQSDAHSEASQSAPPRTAPVRFDDVRARFANDGEVLAVFETLVHRAAGEPYVEPALDSRARARAMTQLWRHLARWLEVPSGAPLRERTLGAQPMLVEDSSEDARAQWVIRTLKEEDEKSVRTMDAEALRQALGDLGWSEATIGRMAAELLLAERGTETHESERPGPQVVPIVASRRSEAKRERKWIASIALGVMALVSLWALRSGNLDAPSKVAAVQRGTDDKRMAMDLRQKATLDCAAARWKTCVEELDQAKETDPEGDQSPTVKKERQAAEAARNPTGSPPLASDAGSGPPSAPLPRDDR